MKDNFLLKQLAQAVVEAAINEVSGYCQHCETFIGIGTGPHKPHCIVLVAEQILKGSEDE